MSAAETQNIPKLRHHISKGSLTNHTVLLKSRPVGEPTEDNFQIVDAPITRPTEGQLLLRILCISVDPYMRGRMNDVRNSYVAPFEVNEPISGYLVAQVIESKATDFKDGDLVTGILPYAEYITVDAKQVELLPEIIRSGKLPLSYGLHVLGMPGMTAYLGLVHIADPKPGETVVVSGAAGAVGSMVGQIAKIKGCRVVGIVGKKEKARYITEKLGFDYAINYKEVSNMSQAIKKACPKGVDIYFDNVGGKTLEAVIDNINVFARISCCGAISEYNEAHPELVKPVSWPLVTHSAKMHGFLIFHYKNIYPEGIKAMSSWILEKKLAVEETIHEGFNSIPKAFIGLFKGENVGKMLVSIADALPINV